MKQVKRHRNAGNAVWTEPLVRNPVLRADESTRLQLRIDDADSLLKVGPFDAQIEIAHPHVEQLLVRPECLTLFVEATGPADPSRAWLRILAHELFPDFVPELVAATELQDSTAFNLSQILAPGANAPPLSRHHRNLRR